MPSGETGGAKRGFAARVNRWLDSDLVGIPATLYTFAVLAISLAVFRFGGPLAGIVLSPWRCGSRCSSSRSRDGAGAPCRSRSRRRARGRGTAFW